MSAIDDRPFPRGALFAAGGVLGLTVLAAMAPRLGLTGAPDTPIAVRAEHHVGRVATRDLVFADRPDGTVAVTEVGAARPLAILHPGMDQGFVRGVMRGMARDRHRRGVSAAEPFRLTLWRNGALSLTDRATGRTIELNSFGSTNRAAFAVLLPGGAA